MVTLKLQHMTFIDKKFMKRKGNIFMKRKIVSIILLCAIVGVQAKPVYAREDLEEYEVNSLQELKEEISDLGENVDDRSIQTLMNNTKPEVLNEYNEFVDDQAGKKLQKAEEKNDFIQKNDKIVYSVEIDPVSKVELELEDAEESSANGDVEINTIKNGSSTWKKYGNRYFTAKYTRYIGTGYAVLTTENHYNVSAKGLKERYGVTNVQHSVGYGASIGGTKDVIEDKTATKKGEDIHIKTWITINISLHDVVQSTTIAERTKVKIVSIDTKNKKIKVKQSWEAL